MEAVEGAVLCMTEIIRENLIGHEMEVWIHQVGLADDTGMLRKEIDEVEAVVGKVKGRAAESRPLSISLSHLKSLLYDADDIVDDLDYFRLQHQVEERGTIAPDVHVESEADEPRNTTGIPPAGRRSKAWSDFTVTEQSADGKPLKAQCHHCRKVVGCEPKAGTSALRNHLKSESCRRTRAANEQRTHPSSSNTDDASNSATVEIDNPVSRKRMRVYESPRHNTAANTLHWNKAECSSKMQQISRQLQEARGAVSNLLNLQTTTSNQGPIISCLVETKIYGRSADMKSILKLMKEDNAGAVTVLPIVGIGGIGKTTLAQFAYNYNDEDVKNIFDHRIWVSVSNNFNEVRLMKDMLDSFSQERHEVMDSFFKLQDKLKPYVESKRLLLIFDDVWDDMDLYTWKKLMAPITNSAQRCVLIVTTRNLSVAKMFGTVEPIELDSLEHDDFWLLFKARAFGDEKYNRHPTLIDIGLKILDKLQGNPLAAETAGMLLRKHLTIDHWSKILLNEEWKSLQISRGIMVSLKRSYDVLPKQLQRCFSYFCFFPKDTIFYNREELIRCWVAQGFVHPSDTNQKLEDVGNTYLDGLVDSGLFQTNKSRAFRKRIYMDGLMHDLAWEVGKKEFATINGSDCEDILPTIRHLSIVGISNLGRDALSCENFDIKVQKVTSMKKLRSLVLLQSHDLRLLKYIQSMIKEAGSLRMLHIFANYDDIISILSNLANCTHLRYLKIWILSINNTRIREGLPIPLSKFYHLEVFDAQRVHKVDGMSNLVNMRYLAVTMGAQSSGYRVGELREHQDVQDFTDQNPSCFEIAQIQPMNKLVKLCLFQLQNGNEAEAYEAKVLRDKELLETLYLSWKDTKNNGLSSDTAKNMLEGLEPHHRLKHLHIIGYNGAVSPKWLATSVTCLQTLHLEGSKEWQKLPYLKSLPLLKRLKLVNMQKVKQVSIPSLEELLLYDMPMLERCSCSSVTDLNSVLRVLEMRQCRELKAFPLFESSVKLKIPQHSWMPCLVKLAILDCPHLTVSYPLPPSNVTADLYIKGVPTLPSTMFQEGSREELMIKLGDELRLLDHRSLAFHSLSLLSELTIQGCGNITYVMLVGLRQLISLRRLQISQCEEFLSSDVVQEDTHEDMAHPHLKHLSIDNCEIKGSLLSRILRHLQALEVLDLERCHLTGLSLEENQSSLPNIISAPENPSDAVGTSSVSDGFLCIPSNVLSSLKRLVFAHCGDPTFYGRKDSFARFTSLEYLELWEGPKFFSSLVHKAENKEANGRWLLPNSLVNLVLGMKHDNHGTGGITRFPDTLQICFPGNQTRLKALEVWAKDLESLQLQAFTALQLLEIRDSELLAELEGLQFLGVLRHLNISGSSNLLPCLEHHATQSSDLLSQLESLEVDTCSVLTTSFCKHLTSLQCLQLVDIDALPSEVTREEQESALQLLTSLEELCFLWCNGLADLPVGLHCLPSLKKLMVSCCPNILKLPEIGLPTSLEELEIIYCSEELYDQCRSLALAESQPKQQKAWDPTTVEKAQRHQSKEVRDTRRLHATN